MANSLISRMRNGEKAAIMEGLSHSGAIYRMNAISFLSIFGVKDTDTTNKLKELKKDRVMLDGYSVADFAMAALDLMKIERYSGNDEPVKNLIQSKFEFLK